MQIQLYHLSCSRSQRIVWLLEELNLPYEFVIKKIPMKHLMILKQYIL